MRIGLTQMNPNKEFPIPQYALPDLVSMGPSWLYAITKTHNNVYTAQRRTQELQEVLREAREIARRVGAGAQEGAEGGGGEGEGHEGLPPLALADIDPSNPPQNLPQGLLDALQQRQEGSQDQDNENMLIQEALFSYRRHPKVIQSELEKALKIFEGH